MRNKYKKILVFAVTFIVSNVLKAQDEANFYTSPTNAGMTINITDAPYNANGTDNNDDTQAITDAIDDLTAASNNGGTIIVPEGTFFFSDVVLKSNIHIRIDSKAVLIPRFIRGSARVFDASGNGLAPINNVSISGDGGRFTVDFSGFSPGENVRFISFGNINNFKVSDVKILDNFTKFPSISFNAAMDNSGVYRRPDKGLIKNIEQTKASYGYGIAQLQSVNNVLFKNLDCEGGVTLRLESGNKSTILSNLNIDNIFGRNINCKLGQSAIQLQPHTDNHGVVDLRNITAVDCEFGVKIDPGFVNASDRALGRTLAGTFDSASIIRNVKVTTTNAPTSIRRQLLRFLPCQFRTEVKLLPRIPGTSVIIGKAIAPAVDFAGNKLLDLAKLLYSNNPNDFTKGDGHYKINFSEADVTAIGFLSFLPKILKNETDDFENCLPIDSSLGITPFMPRKIINTPHSMPEVDPVGGGIPVISSGPNLSNESFAFNTNQVKVYPNPFESENEFLTIDLVTISDVSITISDLMGKLVYSNNFKGQSKVEINLSKLNLAKGTYVVNAKSDIGTVSKKIIVL